mmetsp:Transcript_22667/g.47021  ORF Transcript_22667/g.47021 Transcript_22667/m.47021 type:complete len:243 (-) Transcript_22667:1069-1797(-)
MLQYPTRSRYCWTRQIHQKKHRRAWTLERTRPSGRAEHLPTEATSLPPSSVNWLIWPAVLLEEQVEPREAPHKPASVRRIKSKGTAKSSRQSRPKRAATKKKYRPITRSGNRSKRISAEKNDSLTATEDDSKRSFPVRLFDMLADVEERGLSDIVSWQQHGRAIRVHKPHRFVTDILPHYFRQSKITSFQVSRWMVLQTVWSSRLLSNPDHSLLVSFRLTCILPCSGVPCLHASAPTQRIRL